MIQSAKDAVRLTNHSIDIGKKKAQERAEYDLYRVLRKVEKESKKGCFYTDIYDDDKHYLGSLGALLLDRGFEVSLDMCSFQGRYLKISWDNVDQA